LKLLTDVANASEGLSEEEFKIFESIKVNYLS
jgi:hypothetical protein